MNLLSKPTNLIYLSIYLTSYRLCKERRNKKLTILYILAYYLKKVNDNYRAKGVKSIITNARRVSFYRQNLYLHEAHIYFSDNQPK